MIAVGYYTWQRFDGLVDELVRVSKPNETIGAMRNIQNNLFFAENSIRTYNITRDETDLPQYIAAYDSIERRTDLLEIIFADTSYRDTASALERLDVLRGLINRKVQIQERLIEVIQQDPKEGLDSVLQKLKAVAPQTETQVIVQDRTITKDTIIADTTRVLTKGFLGMGKPRVRKLRKPRKRKNNLQVQDTVQKEIIVRDTITPISSAVVVQNLTAVTQGIRAKTLEFEQEKLEAIRRITERDQLTMDSLKSLLVEMEAEEVQNEALRSEIAKGRTNQSKGFILRFILAALALFLFLIVVIFRDMTLNRRLQRRLAAQKARAEKLAKAKEEFLANMSHEIRTPMNAIIGFTEQLSQTRLNKQQHTFLAPVRHSAQYLLALINDVLDYSKLESGKFTLEEIAFAPNHVMQEVHETFRDRAQNKGLELRLSPADDLPTVVLGDPLRLKQMLFNLVNNAIKFTDEGYVELACTMSPMSDKRVKLHFSVNDTGAGIPEDKLATIFAKFTQADSSTTRKYGGTGLGLAITQELAELHKGDIQISSEVGSGTQFQLTLPYPLGKADQLRAADTPVLNATTALRGKRALVADDEPYNRELIRVILQKWGVDAELVDDGTKSLDALKVGTFDFVLMDLQMPEMDGLTATGHIREDLGLELPVIALTATSTPADRKKCLEAGMDGMILKPFREAELYQQLLDLLNIEADDRPQPPQNGMEAEEEALTPETDTDAPYAFEELFELANRDRDFMLNMLNIFVQSAQTNLQEMKTSSEAGDWEDVSMKAHKLIPPCRHLGLDQLVTELKQIERLAGDGKETDSIPERVSAVDSQIRTIILAIEADMAKL